MSLHPLEMEDTLIPILQLFQQNGSFLKSIRFVSKLWNEVALKQFYKSHFFRIPPNPDFTNSISSSQQDEKEKEAALSQLQIQIQIQSQSQELLERVGTIQNISINDDFANDMKIFQSLEQSQIQIQWEKIKQLRFNFQFERDPRRTRSSEELEDITKFIEEMMTKCPNLKYLDIPPQSNRTFSAQIGFGLMESCIKLDKNENLTISNLAAAVSTERDAKILIGFSETSVRVLNFLAKPLYELGEYYPLEIPAVLAAFEKIIESNKNHLTSLALNDHAKTRVPDFVIPGKMPQLETLHLLSDRESQLKFKDGFQFYRNFPNLNHVNLKLSGCFESEQNGFWTTLFRNQEPCHTVKKLEVRNNNLVEEEIFQVFPAIQELKFCESVVVTTPEVFQYLERNCKKLKILTLDVPSNVLHWHGRQIQFVSNISGFSVEDLSSLLVPNQKMNFTLKAIDYATRKMVLVPFPRIPAFSLLENVEQVHLFGDSEAELLEFRRKYMKFLQQHVFSPMPKLKVDLFYKKYIDAN